MEQRILLSASQTGYDSYAQALRLVGGAPQGGYCPQVDLSCAGLILCGGVDIEPHRYGQGFAGTEEVDAARDEAEFALARAFLAAGRPVLGVCRGHQLLNIVFGGAILQDMPQAQKPFHRDASGEPEDRVHAIRAVPGSALHGLYGEVFSVNSCHHQAVETPAPGFEATAFSEGGVIEAMRHTSLPVWGVQFHPERMCGAWARPDTVDGAALFAWFLRQCGGA